MAKQSHKTKARAKRRTRAGPVPIDRAMLAVGVLGMVLTGLLLWSAVTTAELPYCGADSACDIVQASAWSTVFGLPLALWGLLNYLALAVAAGGALGRGARRWRLLTLLAWSGFGISVYLTGVSLVVLEATCIYCLLSLTLLTVAFVLTLRPATHPGMGAWRGFATLTACIGALLIHLDAIGFFATGGADHDPYLRDLAVHLEARGVKFYGASWCPHCQQQKAMFKGEAGHLPYVECSPHGRGGPRATECEILEIRNYPTWEIDGRRIERLLAVDQLALYSGFPRRGQPAAAP